MLNSCIDEPLPFSLVLRARSITSLVLATQNPKNHNKILRKIRKKKKKDFFAYISQYETVRTIGGMYEEDDAM